MRKCIKLSILLVGIFFLCIGTKVYAFDNDQVVSVQGFNMISQKYWLPTTSPFPTNSNWESLTRNYIYGNFMAPNTANTPQYYSYVRALQGSSDY